MLKIAADPKHLGAKIGITPVLNTWGSAMTHHPHMHMIVPGGGISPDGSQWISCRPKFFLPVRVLSRLFRRLFLEMLVAAHKTGKLKFISRHAGLADKERFGRFLKPLRKSEWVVYAKEPFGGPEAVLAYLSRYTHRVAISNRRLIKADETSVTFRFKDYRIEGPARYKAMTLATHEFIRDFVPWRFSDAGQRRMPSLRQCRRPRNNYRPLRRNKRRVRIARLQCYTVSAQLAH